MAKTEKSKPEIQPATVDATESSVASPVKSPIEPTEQKVEQKEVQTAQKVQKKASATPRQWMRKKRLWAAIALITCFAVILISLPISEVLSQASQWIASQGIWAIPVFTAVYILAAIFGIPNIVLILAAGTLFGLTKGVISASIADTLSIAACFVIGQTVGRRWLTKVVTEDSRFHKLDRAFAKKGWTIVLLTRLSPVLPSNILNYGFSLTKINFWQYLFFSWLGMLPVIFTYVYVGTFGLSILTLDQSPQKLLFQALGLAATVGVMIYTTKLAASALKAD